MVKIKIRFFSYDEPLATDELKIAVTKKPSFKAKLGIEALIYRDKWMNKVKRIQH